MAETARDWSKLTPKEIAAEMDRLTSENAKLKASHGGGRVTFKVAAASKACSVYGLGRFPVTLHISQWNALFDNVPALKAFIEEHKAEFAVKA